MTRAASCAQEDETTHTMVRPLPLLVRLLLVLTYSITSAAYLRIIVSKARPGFPRLLLALPFICGYLSAPLLFKPGEEAFLITSTAGLLSRAAFKVWALCLNRGPLVLDLTACQFVGVLLLPVVPQKGCAIVSSLLLLSTYQANVSPAIRYVVRHWLYCLTSSLFLGSAFNAVGVFTSHVLGVPTIAAFDQPWLSDSFSSFWSRRWNLTTTYLLRVMVYDPIMEGSLVFDITTSRKLEVQDSRRVQSTHKQQQHVQSAGMQEDVREPIRGMGADWPSTCSTAGHTVTLKQAAGCGSKHRRSSAYTEAPAGPADSNKASYATPTRRTHSRAPRFIALQATFAFSGLWHVLIFWYNTRRICFRWAVYFVLQAPLLMLESVIGKQWIASRLPTIPSAVRLVLTQVVIALISGPLFFGPAEESGLAQRNLVLAERVASYMQACTSFCWDALKSMRRPPWYEVADQVTLAHQPFVAGTCDTIL